MKVCAEPGCPALTPTARCPAHTRAKRQERGSSTAQGYGAAHQRERARWQALLDMGATPTCRWCDRPVTSTQAWDLGHSDDRTRWTGPEHAGCNRSAGGKAWDRGIA